MPSAYTFSNILLHTGVTMMFLYVNSTVQMLMSILIKFRKYARVAMHYLSV